MFGFLSKIKQMGSDIKKTPTHSNSIDISKLQQSLMDIAVEEYRIREVITNFLGKLNPIDAPRFETRYRYFINEVDRALTRAGFRIVDAGSFIGKQFDIGMAVKPLNINDFDANDELVIQQVIEPVIMEGENVARAGVVKLRRAN
jgi:hypothetical protein